MLVSQSVIQLERLADIKPLFIPEGMDFMTCLSLDLLLRV